MKKIILIFLTLLMCIACRKAEEIKESVTSPSVVNKTAVSIELLFQGWQILTDSTLESQLWQFEIKKTYSDGSTEIMNVDKEHLLEKAQSIKLDNDRLKKLCSGLDF